MSSCRHNDRRSKVHIDLCSDDRCARDLRLTTAPVDWKVNYDAPGPTALKLRALEEAEKLIEGFETEFGW